MAVIDEATREYLDEHFGRLYEEIKTLRKDDADLTVSVAKIAVTQDTHTNEIKELKSHQWQGIGGLIAALMAMIAQVFSMKWGGH